MNVNMGKSLKLNSSLKNRGGVTAESSLILAAVLALSMTPVYSEELAPIPQNTEDKSNKIADGAIKSYSQNPEKAYTLTKLQEGGTKPAGENIVTKFTYDKNTGSMTPVYYRFDLAKTEYGSGDGVKYYGWTKDESGERVFGEVPKAQADITAKYDTTNLQSHIHNNGTMGDITGDFVGNSANGDGGAIYNSGTIGNITGDFIGNSTTDYYDHYFGGAICNYGTIGNITGDFVGNSANGDGGAIFSENTLASTRIGNIKGDFIDNRSKGDGGAIYNGYYGVMGNITGDFVGNSANGDGGAISNGDHIGDITGNFIGNHAGGYGGAIFNRSLYIDVEIGNIKGDFIGNYVKSTDYGDSAGGAIYNEKGEIGDITGDFTLNSANGYQASGGAIANMAYSGVEAFTAPEPEQSSYIGNITGDFIENKAVGEYEAKGGAVYNEARMGNITGDFYNNSASAEDRAFGGAIYNSWNAQLGTISGDFIGNSAVASGDVDGYIRALGGAVFNAGRIIGANAKGTIDVGKGTFVSPDGSQSITLYAPAFEVPPTGFKTNFIDEMLANDYKIKYIEDMGSQQFSTEEEWQQFLAQLEEGVKSGEVVLAEDFEKYEDIMFEYTPSFKNSSFIGNSAVAKGAYGEAHGGAIYTTKDLLLEATDGYTSIISGNYVEDRNGKRPEAIFMAGADESTLVISAVKNGKFIIDDQINGYDGYAVAFTGDKTGVVYLNNDIKASMDIRPQSLQIRDINPEEKYIANVSLSNITLHLGRDTVLNNNNLTLNSGTLSMVNNQTGVSSLNNLTLKGDTNFVADVDLAKGEMDRFEAGYYGELLDTRCRDIGNGNHYGNLHVAGLNMLSDAPDGQDITEIYFAQIGLKDNVVNGVNQTPTDYQTKAYTPIYQYNVMYDNREDAGYFLFTKGDKIFVPDGNGGTTVKPTPGGNQSDAFNPSVLASPVAAQAGAYAAQNAAFSYAFQHADSFMPLPASQRFALRNANKYAINETPRFDTRLNDLHDKAIWVRPYTSFESIPLKNGPKVDTITYGTLVGGDSQIKELRNGWGTVFTGYMGYNGSNQNYSGVSTYQNGGLLGATQTFYKGNFFTALTASVGASAGESHNMYGHENFTTLMAGLASKSGYNFEFKDGKYIIQPTMQLSYSFINTFDYKNSAGVNIESDPLHAIQINPNIRFITNLKNGWQPYASVGMVWNILDDTKVTANDVRLPEMSVKPYVEYGLGIQKRWKDKFTGFTQAMVRNGGRNGIALTAGFRWALGKEGKPIEKVQNDSKNNVAVTAKTGEKLSSGRKILKQLTPEQRTALGAKPQDTTRTVTKGVLKQL